jgi:mono/diheme cytochrome c family protein
LLAACALSALLPLVAQGPSPKSGSITPAHRQAQNKQELSRGERVFKQNCARCHEAPQSFPPQISGTILRHMRVRASLSAADEKAVMDFMNP